MAKLTLRVKRNWPKQESKQESKYTVYIDANNLYGQIGQISMSKFLPTSKFKRIDTKNVDSTKNSCNSLEGCVLKLL